MIHYCSIKQTWNFEISFSLDATVHASCSMLHAPCSMLHAPCHSSVNLRERIWGSVETQRGRASYNDYVVHLEEPPSLLSNMQDTPRGFD